MGGIRKLTRCSRVFDMFSSNLVSQFLGSQTTTNVSTVTNISSSVSVA